MANSKKDENGRPSLICVSESDGLTIIPIQVNPSNHGLKIDDNTTGSDNGNNAGIAMTDSNGVPVLTALSSNGDGTIIEVYATVDGKLKIDSN